MRGNKNIRLSLLSILWAAFFLSGLLSAQDRQDFEWKLKVSVAQASIRINAAETSRIIATLPKGTIINSYEAEGNWYRVTLAPGKEGIVLIGYVARQDVEILEEKSNKPTDFWNTEEENFKGIGLRLKLAGGWSYFRSGDIDQGAKGLFEIGANSLAARGVNFEQRSVAPIHSGSNLSGDIIYDLGPKFGIGIGFAYTHTLGEDSYIYSELKVYENTMDCLTDLKVFTYKLGAYYTVSLGRLIKIELNAGPALFVTNFDYNRVYRGLEFEESLDLNGKTTSLGVQGGLGLQVPLNDRAALFVDLRGRYAKISNLQGAGLVKGIENDMPVPAVKTSGTLYFVPDTPYPRLAIFPEGSSDAAGARKAVFDFTGADLVAGIRIRF